MLSIGDSEMSLSTIIRKQCPKCDKIAVEKSSYLFGNLKYTELECGHTIHSEQLESDADISKLLNNCTLMPYQVAAVKFLEAASARAILADEQGLGKTIEILALIRLHRESLLPCIIVCPTTVKLQWHHEIINKLGIEGYLTQVVGSSKELAAPGFDIYVTTYDLIKNENCFQLVQDKIKFVVLDECQRVKNHLSERAKAAQKLVKNVEHVIPMSGTPIKNHAGEYFTSLNMVKPMLFPHYDKFIKYDCDSYESGWGYKVGGLRNPETFKEKTKDFILRRTKADVLPDLPELSRKFFHVELDKRMNKAYSEALQELDDLMYSDESEFEKSSNRLAILNKMRWVTGIGKIESCVDFVTEHLMSTDRKIVVFVHHHDVSNLLESKLNQWLTDGGFKPVLNLTSSLSAEARENMATRFRNEDFRVMIASTLAAGEGLNLQFCSDAIMLERQWNPGNENQAEGRFHRFGQRHPVSVTYMIASETVDEYFTELVEQKRAIVSSALDNKEIQWNQQSLLVELANVLVTKGKRTWKL